MDKTNLMDESARLRCTATSKRSGERCKRSPAVGRSVCAAHGGKTPVGPASPHWAGGRYSKILPARLLARYREAEGDEELLALRAEIALLDARLADVLTKVDTGESGRLWSQLRKTWATFEAAWRDNDPVALVAATRDLGELITRGHADWAAWDEVMGLIERRRKVVESERRRRVEERQMISVDTAMSLMAQLIDAVREAGDDKTLRAISSAFARLTGIPDPTQSPADC